MKKLLFFLFLLNGTLGVAQPSKEDIRKYRIHYYQKLSIHNYKDSTINNKSTDARWFDRNGNDSIVYRGYDTLVVSCVYKNGKLMKLTYTDSRGKETDRYEYEYKTDGSYKVTNTDGLFGMKSYEWYDKKDNILKLQSPDRNARIYKYNSKGKLFSVVYDGKNDGIKLNEKYYYNVKGQLIRQDFKMNENTAVVNYEYNPRGQLIKESEKGNHGSTGYVSATTSEYNNKGLVSRVIYNEESDDKEWEKRISIYEYKYY